MLHGHCPGCDRERDMRFPALSRFDNERYVCPECGSAEAIAGFILGSDHIGFRCLVVGLQEKSWSMWTEGLQFIVNDEVWIEHQRQTQEAMKRLRELQEGEA